MNAEWILHCHTGEWQKLLHMVENSIHVGALYLLILGVHFLGNV